MPRPLMLQFPLFVYGTLRSDRANGHLIASQARQVSRATTRGGLHYVDYHDDQATRQITVALDLSGHQKVAGELVELEPATAFQTLADLDVRELAFDDAAIQAEQRRYVYLRTLIECHSGSGSVLAWAYVLVQRSADLGQLVPVPATDAAVVEFTPISAAQFDAMLSADRRECLL